MGVLQLGDVSFRLLLLSIADMSRLVGFSFMFAPLLRDPPAWPLPNAEKEPSWYGEIWFKYPTSDRLYPSYFGQVLEAKSKFRIIMNQACQMAYADQSETTLPEANKFLWQLKYWYDSLPIVLQPSSIVLPGHMQLQ